MLYKSLIRPVFFLFDPETIHHFVISALKIFFRIPGKKWAVRTICKVDEELTRVKIAGITFPNRVGLAAGFDKNAEVYNELSNFGFGFIEIGTVTPLAQPGNPRPRLFRLRSDKGLINRMGFNNQGLEAAIEQLKKRKTKAIIGGNIGKNTLTPNEKAVNDYLTCFKGLFPYVDYFVVNVSCPNITDLHELQDENYLDEILRKVMAENNSGSNPRPVFLKISPDLNNNQLDSAINLVLKNKISGIIATNTSIQRKNLSISETKIKSIGNGGLSGKPLQNRSDEIIRYVRERAGNQFAIIGVGGIFSPKDAILKIKAGADLVQIYSGFIYEGPFMVSRINKAIAKYFNTVKLKNDA